MREIRVQEQCHSGLLNIEYDRLTDDSLVYNVMIGNIMIPCVSEEEAYEIYDFLKDKDLIDYS